MRPCYKFLDSKHVDQMLSGEFRFTKLSVFRKMEKESASWIADRMEGTTELQLSHIYRVDEATPEAIAKFNATFAPPGVRPFFILPPGGKNITISGTGKIGYIHADDPYIFCCSQGDLRELTKTMCEAPKDAKDACVRIINFRALAQRIITECATEDLPRRPFRMQFWIGPIRYAKLFVKQGEALEPPSPFTKDISFRKQREVRIALLPRIEGNLPPVITFRIAKPHELIWEEFRDYERPISF